MTYNNPDNLFHCLGDPVPVHHRGQKDSMPPGHCLGAPIVKFKEGSLEDPSLCIQKATDWWLTPCHLVTALVPLKMSKQTCHWTPCPSAWQRQLTDDWLHAPWSLPWCHKKCPNKPVIGHPALVHDRGNWLMTDSMPPGHCLGATSNDQTNLSLDTLP